MSESEEECSKSSKKLREEIEVLSEEEQIFVDDTNVFKKAIAKVGSYLS